MSLKCFHWSLICSQLVGFITPQMLLDVFAIMTVFTRPSRLSKPISMVADFKLTFWPLATLIITFSFLPSNPSSSTTSSLTYDVSLPSSKKQLTCYRLPPCFRETGTVHIVILLCSCSCTISYVLDLFPSVTDVSSFPYVDQELLSHHEVTGGVGPCIRQFHTLCSKHMSHQAAVAQSKFLRRLPFLFKLRSLEHVTFPKWVCALYRDDHVSLPRSRNKTWLSSFLVHFQHWANHT